MRDPTILSIAGSGLSATVSTLGAELQTLRDGEGHDLLWHGDPAVWSGRAPLLFPIVGRLAGDRVRAGEAAVSLPQHGFARRLGFEVVRAEADAVVLALGDNAQTRAAYPFRFRLEVTHRIADARIETVATVRNPGRGPLPFQFGFHPGLRWPLPWGGAREEHAIRFEAEEPGPVLRPTADGLIDPTPRPSPVAGRVLALSDDLFAEGALVFRSLRSRRLDYGVPGGRRIAVDFEGTPDLGLWTKPGARAPYLCIEPWHGHADLVGRHDDVFDRPGTVVLAPGEARSFRMGLGVVD